MSRKDIKFYVVIFISPRIISLENFNTTRNEDAYSVIK